MVHAEKNKSELIWIPMLNKISNNQSFGSKVIVWLLNHSRKRTQVFPSPSSYTDIEFDTHQVLYRRCGYQAVAGGLQCERIVNNINEKNRCDYHTNISDLQAMCTTTQNNVEVGNFHGNPPVLNLHGCFLIWAGEGPCITFIIAIFMWSEWPCILGKLTPNVLHLSFSICLMKRHI